MSGFWKAIGVAIAGAVAYAIFRPQSARSAPFKPSPIPPPIPTNVTLAENAPSEDDTRVGILPGGWMWGVHEFANGARDVIYLLVEQNGAVTSYTASTRLTGQIVSPGTYVVQRLEKFFQSGAPVVAAIDADDVAATSSWERAQLTADDTDVVYLARSTLGEHTYPLAAWCAMVLLPPPQVNA